MHNGVNYFKTLFRKIIRRFFMKFFLRNKKFLFPIFVLLCFSCENKKNEEKKTKPKIDYVTRRHDSYFDPIPKKIFLQQRELYPWEEGIVGDFPKITKEFFRCKGNSMNPPIVENLDDEKIISYEDCDGYSKHSLPIIHGKEGVYPILIDLLNYIQCKTLKKVVITSGHSCPKHNKYCDRSKSNICSKHMIGAEVDFYVQGMENNPQEIVDLILAYYKEGKQFSSNKDFTTFRRYEKEDTNVSTKPWFNKEVFVKLFKENEGRDHDNRHPYPYVSIQVRYDRKTDERVVYTWEKATSGYLRW